MPQLNAIKAAIIDQPNKVFYNDPDAQFKINAIDKEIARATHKPRSNKFGVKAKALNPYNAHRISTPIKRFNPKTIPSALGLMEIVTKESPKYIAQLLASAPDIAIEAKNAFGYKTRRRTKYEKGKTQLDWDNTLNYYNYIFDENLNKSPFQLDTLYESTSEWKKGKEYYKGLQQKNSELLRVAPNSVHDLRYNQPGLGMNKLYKLAA